MNHRQMEAQCLPLMQNVFGVKGFRPGQWRAVYALLSGRDTLCLFPTGAGKSLCYQLPALVLPPPTLVISPLIALMRDQVGALRAKGICAVSLDSMQTPAEFEAATQQIAAGEARLIYVSPERLQSPGFRSLCAKHPPSLVAVDEAHCVLDWGEHFRPAYTHIAEFIAALPVRPTVCAMTATADHRTREGILRLLGMRGALTVSLPLVRENLRYQVVTTLNPQQRVLDLVAAHAGQKGLIFCRTRAQTERWARLLATSLPGLRVAHYHAGLDSETRQRLQTDYAAGRLRLMCCTSAFGMGVDVPDIRYVLHVHLPDRLQDYAQQAGRAGRDGQQADCVLLLDPLDLERHRRDLMQRRKKAGLHPGRRLEAWKAWRHFQPMLRYALTDRCRAAALAKGFGQRVPTCGCCDVCRGGKPVHITPPSLYRMSQADLTLWVLRWQRTALARQRGVAPMAVVSEDALLTAVRTGALPPGAADPAAMAALNRVARHMRRGEGGV